MFLRLSRVIVVLATIGASVVVAVAATASPSGAAASAPVPTVGMVTDLTWGISRSDMDRTVGLLASSGVKAVRLNVSWSGVERDGKGIYNTSWLVELDYAVTQARAAGIEVLMPIADGVPLWASGDPTRSATTWNKMWKPAKMSDYGDFVGFVVRRYSPMGVSAYEIWNEPNLAHFWPSGVNAAHYTEMLRAGSAAVRTADPSAKVLLGGLSKSDRGYMAALYAAGAGPLFDIAAIHPYVGNAAPDKCWIDASGFKAKDAFCGIEAVRDVMVANGDSVKPLWLTEFGWSTTSAAYGVSEAQQASNLTAAFAWLSSRTYVHKAFWYGFRNTYWLTDDPAEYEANTGVLRTDYSPKQSFTALQSTAGLQAPTDSSTTTPTTAAPSTTTPPTTSSSTSAFTALAAPARMMDTRNSPTIDGRFSNLGHLPVAGVTELTIAGRAGIPAGATAAVLNVTVVDARGPGHITVYPCGQARPNASNLNFVAGETIPNSVITAIGTAGKVCIYNGAATGLIVDAAGTLAPSALTALAAPARMMDTRNSPTIDGRFSNLGHLPVAGVTELTIAGRAGIPAGATAAVLNVTVVDARGPGHITVYPCGQARPNASNLNFVAGETIPNSVITAIGTAGKVCIYNGAATGLIVDAAGTLAPSALTALAAPARMMDTRNSPTIDGRFSNLGHLPVAGVTELTIAGRAGIPAGATAAVLNVTVVDARGPGHITVYPCGQARPNASNLNFVAGETIPNSVITAIGTAGKVCIYNGAATGLIVDAAGTLS